MDVTSGSVSPTRVPARRLGFVATGEPASVTRARDRDVVAGYGPSGEVSQVASVLASPLMTGRRFRSWFSRGSVAFHNDETVGGGYALRVVRVPSGQPVATLTWSRRTGTFLAVHGWWDDQRILVSLDRSLVTWAPETGRVVRVAALPRSDLRLAHGSVGVSFPGPVVRVDGP